MDCRGHGDSTSVAPEGDAYHWGVLALDVERAVAATLERPPEGPIWPVLWTRWVTWELGAHAVLALLIAGGARRDPATALPVGPGRRVLRLGAEDIDGGARCCTSNSAGGM